MTPFPRPQEIARMQQECREALEQSKTAEGFEKLRLINKAFPFAIQGAGHGLRIAWVEDGWSISDAGGFITVLDRHDAPTMLVMIGMESARAGSVREVITGRKKVEPKQSAFPPFAEHIRRKPKKEKPTLESLGLTNVKLE